MFVLTLFCYTGLFFIFPCTDNILKLDLRVMTYDVPPQEVRVDYELSLYCIDLFWRTKANDSQGCSGL